MKMSMIFVLCFGCALVAVSQAQDMTSLMFQAMGIEMPPMPPQMPQSLREHLYPRQLQQLKRQQTYQLQQAAAARAAQYGKFAALQKWAELQKIKANPYSIPFSSANKAPEKTELLVSQANAIRQPGDPNALNNKVNPYSVSRATSSGNAAVRNAAVALRPPRLPSVEMYRQIRQWREQPKKVQEAQAAGCKLPVDNSAGMMMVGDCRSSTARMMCQMEMMSCINVGMTAMCCPYGMNKLAMDTMSYVNKLQHYMSEIA